jgi:flagellar biosynthesis protein FlhG
MTEAENTITDTPGADARRRPRIWAVGGGKGGVGKTLVASSLAVALARSGMRCVAIDADFGAANLHTVLGISEPRLLLRHFLDGQVASLDEIACQTKVPKLRLLSGARGPAYAANLDHPRRQKLLRHLRKLDTDEVVIDLGAGSGFNALDFFVEADLNLAVVTPQATAIENAYHFVKAAWFRTLRPAAARPEVREVLMLVLGGRKDRGCIPPHKLIEVVSEVDRRAAAQLQHATDSFRPAIVVNCVSTTAQRMLADQIANSCLAAIGANARSVGSLSQDSAVPRALECGQPLLERFPTSRFAYDIYAMAERLLLPPPEPEQVLSQRRLPLGRLRNALGLDREWIEKQSRVHRMAELAAGE